MARRERIIDLYYDLREGNKVEYQDPWTGEIREAVGVSDFPNLLGSVMGKRLIEGFTASPSPWATYCEKASVSRLDTNEPDIVVGQFPDLIENTTGKVETEEGYLPEHATNRIAREWKRGLVVGRAPIVNDDTDFFSKVPYRMGDAAMRTLAKKVVEVLEANGAAWDGKAFFHADHGNLDSSSSVAWYLFADPNVIPAITVSFLKGVDQPQLLVKRAEMVSVVGGGEDPFDYVFDEIRYKVRFDFGVKLTEYVGAYKSTQPFTPANLAAAVQAFMQMRSEDGQRIGVVPKYLVVPSSLYIKALEFCNSTEIRDTTTNTVRGTANALQGLLTPVVDPYLATT